LYLTGNRGPWPASDDRRYLYEIHNLLISPAGARWVEDQRLNRSIKWRALTPCCDWLKSGQL
jgi:hypothetical protein